ncbi:1,4-dihydroxy-2-naphthoate octaprenyltransferase [Flavobacterium sp. GT3R68]|uniref:1,4-dihydroxy-2-naphthoate octaprenyltransferase n=1 Tax=Flavobacterium sp. GT3R68 TaxID=2594437 RepID=UPI000F87C022|nr:1,4-dihydroxy-2-naphthoate octaprenyltransferase [Flavobacterium sp. GT3R68]RTY95006.1 1,4-dihydroxy-2-naphthoate octaprenyltransferase [Flavobacterium sp. GSN2]TRW91811.1 1,4-dihydroxy-2-naphthoate octaprenyltransferase [Flavobacterium sp. GT3R68]
MKHWIEAARLRTLPLSVSGILVGSFFAMSQGIFNWKIVILALSTTLGLQILSNFANDYGDGMKGTDNEDRVGPKRAIQSGVITPGSMRYAIFITAFLTLVSAMLLIYFSFKGKYLIYSILFFVLGILAIASAIRYTVGKNPYGYRGYGDVFVFVFFGLVSTFGIYFMFSKQIDLVLFLPAAAIGFLSVGVLNLNNMRDEESDKKSGKNTIVVKNGGAWAKKYHFFLIVSAMILMLLFAVIFDFSYRDQNPEGFNFDLYFFLIAYFPIFAHLNRVAKNKEHKLLDPELKKLALSTFLLSILLSLSMIYFLSDIVVNLFLGGR